MWLRRLAGLSMSIWLGGRLLPREPVSLGPLLCLGLKTRLCNSRLDRTRPRKVCKAVIKADLLLQFLSPLEFLLELCIDKFEACAVGVKR